MDYLIFFFLWGGGDLLKHYKLFTICEKRKMFTNG